MFHIVRVLVRSVPRGTRRHVLHLTILLRKLMDEVSADSGLQLDLEIALNVVSAKIQPHELFSSAEDALKRRVT